MIPRNRFNIGKEADYVYFPEGIKKRMRKINKWRQQDYDGSISDEI